MLSLHGDELGCGVYFSTKKQWPFIIVSEQNHNEKRLFQVEGVPTIGWRRVVRWSCLLWYGVLLLTYSSLMVLIISLRLTVWRGQCMITCSMFCVSSPQSHIWVSTKLSLWRCALSLLCPVLALMSLASWSLDSVDLYFPFGTFGMCWKREQPELDLFQACCHLGRMACFMYPQTSV